MNRQNPPGAIEWTRIALADGTVRPGYTWNPVGGCKHGCRWKMPDGTTAECYAETVAEGVASAAYPKGFETHYWHPDILDEPLKLKTPAGIFQGSMTDWMGSWVPAEEIDAVLDVMCRADWHTFMTLTKNAPRLLRFQFAPNVWVGASVPPDVMRGVTLTRRQQMAMLDRTLDILAQIDTPVRWISFEPLSWDCADIVRNHHGAIQWAVIGAASRGRAQFAPNDKHLNNLLRVLDTHSVPTFFKGNLATSPLARADWRAAFPPVAAGTLSQGRSGDHHHRRYHADSALGVADRSARQALRDTQLADALSWADCHPCRAQHVRNPRHQRQPAHHARLG